MRNKLVKTEALIADAVGCTNGACVPAAAAAVEAATRRARQKHKMLPIMGTDLVLAALDEVAFEIASLPGANVANATLMRELTEGMIPTTPQHATTLPSTDPTQGLSIRTQRGEETSEEEEDEELPNTCTSTLEKTETETEKTRSGEINYNQGQPHSSTSSVIAVKDSATGAVAGGKRGDLSVASDLESTAGNSGDINALTTTATIMAPLYHLAEEMCKGSNDLECSALRKTLRLKKPKSGDLKVAKELDFDQCASPRCGTGSKSPNDRHHHRLGTPKMRGECLEYGLTPHFTPRTVQPASSLDQFSPMVGRQELLEEADSSSELGKGGTLEEGFGSVFPGGELGSSGEWQFSGGGSPFIDSTFSSPVSESEQSTRGSTSHQALQPEEKSSKGAASPQKRQWHLSKVEKKETGGHPEADVPAASAPQFEQHQQEHQHHLQGPSQQLCEAGVPPGLSSTARVQGAHSDGHFITAGEGAEKLETTPFGEELEGEGDESALQIEIRELCSQMHRV